MSDHWHLTIDITRNGLTASDGASTWPVQTDADAVRTALTGPTVTAGDGTAVPSGDVLASTVWGCLAACGRPGAPSSVTVNAPDLTSPPDRRPLGAAFTANGVDPATVSVTARPAPGNDRPADGVPPSTENPRRGRMSPVLVTVIAIAAILVLVLGVLGVRSFLPSPRNELLPEMLPDRIATATAVDGCTSPADGGDGTESVHCTTTGLLEDGETGRSHRVYGVYFHEDPTMVASVSGPDPLQDEVAVDVSPPAGQRVRVVHSADAVTTVYHTRDSVLAVYGATGVDADDVDSLVRSMGLGG